MCKKDIMKKLSIYVFLIITAIIIVFPFLWMIFTSLKPENDIVTYPPKLFPKHISLENFQNIWKRIPFGMFFKNSVFFAITTTLLSLFFDSLSAYALARLHFPGRDIIFIIILATLMIPFQVIMIPLFITLYHMKILNTFRGLIIPKLTSAFGIFLLRQFFVTLPKELEDSARIDGAGEFRIYFQIILPLSKPALASLFVFHFMYFWNELLWPLIVTNSMEKRTLPVGLALFMGQHVVEYGVLMAGATIALFPIVIFYLSAQKYFVKGIALTGTKF